MSVYNDMACDAGYPYGSSENQQMAQMIEAEQRRQQEEEDAYREIAQRDFEREIYGRCDKEDKEQTEGGGENG